MPRSRTLLILSSGLCLLRQHQRISDLTTLLRLQRTELNYVRCELRAHASLLGIQREEAMSRHPSASQRHLHGV